MDKRTVLVKTESGLLVPQGIGEFLARRALRQSRSPSSGPMPPVAQQRHGYRGIRHHKGRKR